MNYFDAKNFGTGAQQQWTANPKGWGSGEMNNPYVQIVQQGTEMFRQQFKNLTGRDPTPDELGAFQTQALPSLIDKGAGYGDYSSLANNYIQTQDFPAIQKYHDDQQLASQKLQQQQQEEQLPKTQSMIQDLINKTMSNTAGQFSDPTSNLYQKFSGNMNNYGITPSSGAFQAGAGSTIAQSGVDAGNQALQAIGLPVAGNIQNLSSTGYTPNPSFGGNNDLSHLNSLNDFQLQSQLAKMLQGQMGPSSLQNMLGMASGSAQGANSVIQGGTALKSTSYVCKELIKRGLICEQDMDDFHAHIMPALFKKGRAFWKYAMDGKRLVDAANASRIDWAVFKPLLFDLVMAEKDSCRAVDLYATACKMLALGCDPSLWDERVMRTSFWDSLIFLPRLLTYRPFIEALWKCVRMKIMFVLDRPRCEVHR